MNKPDDKFQAAIEAHQLALAMYGEDDVRTVEALMLVMATATDEVFAAVEEMARATFH
jgi:hypothetical protein